MKVDKVTMQITVETTHLDSIPALLYEAAEAIRNETSEGQIRKEDGDEINWDSFLEVKEL